MLRSAGWLYAATNGEDHLRELDAPVITEIEPLLACLRATVADQVVTAGAFRGIKTWASFTAEPDCRGSQRGVPAS